MLTRTIASLILAIIATLSLSTSASAAEVTVIVDYPVILPTDTTTVTVCILVYKMNGTAIYVPEESPEGGYPEKWADNSPVYTDGWMLRVDDSTHTTYWVAPTFDPTHSDLELGA